MKAPDPSGADTAELTRGFRVQFVALAGTVGFGPVVSEREELLVHAMQVIDGALVAFEGSRRG